MKIAKEFYWEMGHRLPNHKGLCRNIHGHSYKMIVEIEGDIKKNGMVIDFYELGLIINPIIDKFDHSFMVWKGDKKLIEFLEKNKMKKNIVDYYSTVENICIYLLDIICTELKRKKIDNIYSVSLKIFESPNSFAELTKEIN